jgi:hypothetical protein
MGKISQSLVGIRVLDTTCPQKEVWRKVWAIQPGTKVRLYVGTIKPTLPLPTLSQVPMYWEMWDNELEIEIIAADEITKSYWEYFRQISLDWVNK